MLSLFGNTLLAAATVWFVTLPAAILFSFKLAWFVERRSFPRMIRWSLLLAVLGPLVTIVILGLLSASVSASGSPTALWIIFAVFAIVLIASVVIVIKALDHRFAAAAISGFGVWLTLCACSVAVFTVSH